MAFQSVPHVVQVELHYTIGDQFGMNRVMADVGHEVTAADLETAATEVDGWFTGDVLPSVSQDLALFQTRAVDLEHETSGEFVVFHTPAVQGSVTEVSLPAEAALVTSLRTNSLGRSYRGRFYLAGLPRSQQADPQHMQSTYSAAVNDMFVSLISVLNAAGYALGVVSRVADGVARAVGIITEVTGLITNNRIDSQRRRGNP